ncbi:MAG: PIG-L family deacetylase, partial [Acidobacteriota bacterium]
MKRLNALVCGVLVLGLGSMALPGAGAQTPEQVGAGPRVNYRPLEADRGAAAVWQSLLKLHTRASMLTVVAHPDDEDGGMLAYESRGQGARVALLTLNRGEGGQNVMSDDYWDRLGLARTQELLAADRYYGVQQYFSRAIDFGFSKTREEALQQWGRQRTLCDVVRVVRMTRPLVMTATFIGNITDGHGQHQVSGQMNQEAYKDAGDPSVCPNQIAEGLLPWTPLKVYARVPSFSISPKGMYDYATDHWAPVRFFDYVTGQWTNQAPETNLEISEGGFDPLIGDSYLQYARQGWGEQKTQNGGGAVPLPGAFQVPYHRYGSRVPAAEHEKSFFDGIDVSLEGIATLAPGDNGFLKQGLDRMDALVGEAMRDFSASQPEKIAPVLAEGLKTTRALMAQVESSSLSKAAKYNVMHELRIKEVQFNNALAESLQVTVTALLAPPQRDSGRFGSYAQDVSRVVIPGQTFGVDAYVANESAGPVQIQDVSVHASQGTDWKIEAQKPANGELASGQRNDVRFQVTAPEDAPLTRPYFHRDDVEQADYHIDEPQFMSLPFAPYPLAASATFSYHGVPFTIAAVVQTAQHVTGYGTLYDPLIVTPAISVTAGQHATILPLDRSAATLEVTVHNNVPGAAAGSLHLKLPAGWSASPETAEFKLSKQGEDQSVGFTLHPSGLEQKQYSITAAAEYNGKEYTEGYVTTGYPGLHPYNEYRPARETLTGVDVKVAPGLDVGYVMGTGDHVPQSLESLGVTVHLLGSADLATGDLSR